MSILMKNEFNYRYFAVHHSSFALLISRDATLVTYRSMVSTNRFVIEATNRMLSMVIQARHKVTGLQKYKLWQAVFIFTGTIKSPTRRSLTAREMIKTLFVIFLNVLVFKTMMIKRRLPKNATVTKIMSLKIKNGYAEQRKLMEIYAFRCYIFLVSLN